MSIARGQLGSRYLLGDPAEGPLVALLDGLLPALLLGAALEVEAFAGVAVMPSNSAAGGADSRLVVERLLA